MQGAMSALVRDNQPAHRTLHLRHVVHNARTETWVSYTQRSPEHPLARVPDARPAVFLLRSDDCWVQVQ